MDYIQFFTIMATLLTGFVFMIKEFKAVEKDLREDIKIQNARTDQLYQQLQDAITSQSSRSDRIYEMFCSLLKEKK